MRMMVEDQEDLSAIIQLGLKARGRTQRELAAYLGCSPKHLSGMMTGKVRMTVERQFKIFDYLEIRMVLAQVKEEDRRS